MLRNISRHLFARQLIIRHHVQLSRQKKTLRPISEMVPPVIVKPFPIDDINVSVPYYIILQKIALISYLIHPFTNRSVLN